MLATSKAQLLSAMKNDVVQLQNQELTYFLNNNSSLGTMSAVVAGFAFTGLCIDSFVWTSKAIQTLYYLFAALAMGFALLTVLYTAGQNILGPGLALTGPEGSMKMSVDIMRQEQKYSVCFFMIAIVCFHISGILYAQLNCQPSTARWLVTFLLLGFLLVFFSYVKRMIHLFGIDAKFLSVRGVYSAEDLMDDLESANLLERSQFDSPHGRRAPGRPAATRLEPGIVGPGRANPPEPQRNDSSRFSPSIPSFDIFAPAKPVAAKPTQAVYVGRNGQDRGDGGERGSSNQPLPPKDKRPPVDVDAAEWPSWASSLKGLSLFSDGASHRLTPQASI